MAAKKASTLSQYALSVAVILGFVAVANYLVTKVFLRWDLTENKEFSISPASKKILKNLDDIVNVKVYFSKKLPAHLEKVKTDVSDILSEYKAYAGRNLRVSWEDPGESEETKRKVRALGIPEIQMQTIEKDQAQVVKGFLGIAVLYGDKKEVLPLVQDLSNFEYNLTQAVMKVLRTETPKIAVLKTDTGAYIPPEVRMQMRMNVTDKTEEKYQPLFENLRKNYEVDMVDISDGQKIDAKYKTLIVPGGEVFTTRKLYEIDQFFMNGGNIIVLADAVRVEFSYGVMGFVQHPQLLDMLEFYGAKVESNMVLDASCGQVQIPQNFGGFQMNVAVNYPYFVRLTQNSFNPRNPAVAGLGEVILPWPSTITLVNDPADSAATKSDTGEVKIAKQDVKGAVLAKSSPRSWTAKDYFNLNPQQDWKPPAEGFRQSNLMVYLHGNFTSYFAGKPCPPVKDSAATDSLSKISLKPEDKQRETKASNTNRNLVVVGTSGFLTAQNAAPGNIGWLLNAVDWLSLDDNLIAIRSRTLTDRSIQSDRLKEGSSKTEIIRWVNIALMPLILIATGLVIFFRRREPAVVATADKAEEKKHV